MGYLESRFIHRAVLHGRGPRYAEVDIDVGSSSVAAAVVGLVQGATRSLVVDMGIVLEGHAREELPEALLGTVRACVLPFFRVLFL